MTPGEGKQAPGTLAQPDGVRNHFAASKADTSGDSGFRGRRGPGMIAEVTADNSWEWRCFERR